MSGYLLNLEPIHLVSAFLSPVLLDFAGFVIIKAAVDTLSTVQLVIKIQGVTLFSHKPFKELTCFFFFIGLILIKYNRESRWNLANLN